MTPASRRRNDAASTRHGSGEPGRTGMKVLFGWMLMAFALLGAAPRDAVAQDYPARNVTILVPFAAGGGTDMIARAIAQRLEQKIGKSFVIENRPGAGTAIAPRAAAQA